MQCTAALRRLARSGREVTEKEQIALGAPGKESSNELRYPAIDSANPLACCNGAPQNLSSWHLIGRSFPQRSESPTSSKWPPWSPNLLASTYDDSRGADRIRNPRLRAQQNQHPEARQGRLSTPLPLASIWSETGSCCYILLAGVLFTLFFTNFRRGGRVTSLRDGGRSQRC